MSKLKTINIPLFWKFSIVAIFIVLVFGMVNIFLLWNSVYQSFEKEIDKRCKVISSIIAEKVLSPIVYDDLVNIYTILDEIRKSDPSIAYIFLLDGDRKIIANVPDMKIPRPLIEANDLELNQFHIKVIAAKNFKYNIIRDIAYPIMLGDVGVVRLGIVEESIRKELNIATKKLLIMISIFLLLGLIGAFYFSYLITSPIKRISERAQNVNLDSISEQQFNIKPPGYKIIGKYYFMDELDYLVSKFNLMLIRLKENVLELKKTRDSFVQAEKLASIGTLTSGIGHEINNPISGIKNCINRISKDPSNIEQNVKYLDLIKGATQKIERVVQQLLNFSRKQDVVYEKINPVELLNEAIKLAMHKISKHNIKIEHSLCCVQYIKASSNQLEQVFLNLILNAIDAIDERRRVESDFQGEIILKIECINDKSIIRFIDNGIGVKEEFQTQIFDPFFTTKEVGKGTGLGLYVSIDIINKHGGNLSYNSTYGKGTEFVVEMPLESMDEIDDATRYLDLKEY